MNTVPSVTPSPAMPAASGAALRRPAAPAAAVTPPADRVVPSAAPIGMLLAAGAAVAAQAVPGVVEAEGIAAGAAFASTAARAALANPWVKVAAGAALEHAGHYAWSLAQDASARHPAAQAAQALATDADRAIHRALGITPRS